MIIALSGRGGRCVTHRVRRGLGVITVMMGLMVEGKDGESRIMMRMWSIILMGMGIVMGIQVVVMVVVVEEREEEEEEEGLFIAVVVGREAEAVWNIIILIQRGVVTTHTMHTVMIQMIQPTTKIFVIILVIPIIVVGQTLHFPL